MKSPTDNESAPGQLKLASYIENVCDNGDLETFLIFKKPIPESLAMQEPGISSQIENIDLPEPDISQQPEVVEAPVADAPAEQDAPAPVAHRRPDSNTVRQDAPVFEPVANWDANGITLAFPSDTFARTQEAIDRLPNVNIGDTKEGREWAEVLKASRYTVQYKDQFIASTEREGAQFRQAVPSERGPLTAAAPNFKDSENTKLTGERAVLRVRALLNMGSIVQIPLWHSGFWLSLKAPSEGDMLELNRRLMDEKVSLGRTTYGLAYANTSVFFVAAIMDFAMTHYYDSSLKDNSQANVRSKISSLDIPLIAWGLACVIWPRGFQYARAVIDGEVNRTIKERLNVGKLLWTDVSSLTPWQVSHMAQRSGNTMTNEAVQRYRDEFTRGKGRTIELRDNLKVTVAVPSMDDYLASGQKWVNNIVRMVDAALAVPPDSNERDTIIYDHGKATNMRQYRHWVESIEVGTNVIEDEETLDQTIDVLSADDDIRAKYFQGIRDYMEDSTIALIAVPAATEQEESGMPRFPHLLPLDAVSTFFTLLVQKIAQIQNRN